MLQENTPTLLLCEANWLSCGHMKLHLFVIFILLIPINVLGQLTNKQLLQKIDSAWTYLDYGLAPKKARALADELNAIYEENGSYIARINALQIIGESYYYSPHIDSALYWYEKAKAFSKANDDLNELAHTTVSLGSILSEMSRYDEACAQFDESIKIRESLNDTDNLVFIYIKKAWTNNMADKHDLAMEDYLIAEAYAREIKDTAEWANALNGMAIVQKKQNNLEKSEELFLQAIDLQESIGDIFGKTASEGNLAMVYKSMGQYERAYSIYPPLVDLYTKEGFDLGVMSCCINMAICSNFLGEHRRAIKEGKKGEKIAINNSQAESACDISNEIAKAYLQLNILDSAMIWAEKAAVLAEDNFSLEKEMANALTLSEIHAAQGNHRLALDEYKRYSAVKDSIFESEKSRQVLDLQAKYETAQRERQIAILEADAQLKEQTQFTLLLGLIFVFIGAIAIINRETKRRKKAQELHESEIKRARLEQEKLQNELEFKNRELVSKALHIAQKNEMLHEIQERLQQHQNERENEHTEVDQVIRTLNFDQKMSDHWDQFTQTFTETNPNFFRALNEQYQGLTKNELRLCALLKMNLGNKDIANMLNISDDGVKKARYRLRKKLDLQTNESLDEFILRIDSRAFSA